MQLNSHKPDMAVNYAIAPGRATPQTSTRQNLDWSSKPYVKRSPEYQADTWVNLLELPSRFSFEEALLLCQLSEDEWVAWIPNHGEALLHTRQFCPAS